MNFDRLREAETQRSPYTYIIARDVVSRVDGARIRADYPTITKSGFIPLSRLVAAGAFASLIDDLQRPELAEILSEKLDIDLRGKPRMITVRRHSRKGDGVVHNDSVSKICTMLVYLNDEWSGSDGSIRVLNGPDDMDDYTVEVPPLTGAVFAFARSENSWHGHPPFTGDRYVVQTTFLVDEAALAHKEKTGGISYFLKKLNPF